MAQERRSPFQTRTEDEDEVRNLGDLIDARENPTQDDVAVVESEGEDEDLDIEDALTFPQKRRVHLRDLARADAATDFDADARTATPADDADDASYMTRADLVDSMNLTDPDPNAGADEDDFIGDANIDRAPDITGTVTGINRGMATHLPQDIGRDGFQIEEPEAIGDPQLLDETDDADDRAYLSMEDDALLDEDDGDAGVLPVRRPDVDTRDEALDATRRLK